MYTDPEFVQKTVFLRDRKLTTTFIQNVPRVSKSFRSYLPLMPLAVEQLDMSPYDLVISSAHAVAKGVLAGPNQLHISYVHSPFRYAWDLQRQYLRESGLNRGIKAGLRSGYYTKCGYGIRGPQATSIILWRTAG